ncbi:MAG: ATP-binding protein [Candidatus Aminicenantales bacterium]
MKKRVYFSIALVTLLATLGGLNIYRKITWREPTDGVTWRMRAGRLTALSVEPNSPGYLAGIKKGDILYSLNDIPTKSPVDVVKSHWAASVTGQKIKYQIAREGELLVPSLYISHKRTHLAYYYLALIGVTTLVIGIIVFFSSRKTLSMPYLYFYLLCLLLYSFYTFSPTGELDFPDTIFYWLDKVAFLSFPPMLLHFFLIFPQRKRWVRRNPKWLYLFYVPASALGLMTIGIHLPVWRNLDDASILSVYSLLERLGIFHFALFTLITLMTIYHSLIRPPSLIARKQLRWIFTGLGVGMVPFAAFYAVPYILGQIPPQFGELTILLQALVPLTFAYSVSRYRLMDFEVLLKKAATLIFSYFILASLYVILSARTQVFSEEKLNVLVLGILAMILGATLFSPLKKLLSSLLDRFFYRRTYKYRKTLLTISRELSRERNLDRLSQSLLGLIANALMLKEVALLLPETEESQTFRIVSSRGGTTPLPRQVLFTPSFFQSLKEKDYISYYSLAERREMPKPANSPALAFFHYLPFKVEDKLIGCLAMGKKVDNSFLNSEDWELLTTISSPVALAIENAALYHQASIRTEELERLKDYSENIIESLTVGVAVLNQKGEIIGWNRVLEGIFGMAKGAVLGRNLEEVLGPKNYLSLFPTDTQQDFRLLSEITLEMAEGEKKIFDVAKTPLLDNRLIPYGTIIVFEDVTEKVRLQQQLVTSEKLASIGLLSAGVAHEINTPLTGISSYIQMLQKKLSDPHYAQILEKIEAQTERVSKIVKNLLNFARNPSDTTFHKVNVIDSLKEIISLIDYKLKAMNIKLDLALQPIKPIWAQGERLQQVFINIILNAIDAMPNGGRLRIEAFEKNEDVVIKIADTGTGIKKQHLPHIFDPFFTTKGVGKGTGLGLSISYAIIKEHEGNIAVESEVGKGSCFSIHLPLRTDPKKIVQKTHYVRN